MTKFREVDIEKLTIKPHSVDESNNDEQESVNSLGVYFTLTYLLQDDEMLDEEGDVVPKIEG